MADKTGIEWTDATWNPVTGCTEVSPGCDHCYAKTFAERWRGTPGHHFEHGFDVVLRPERLDQPLRWQKPRRIFVNSMSDLFHDEIPNDFIAQVFAVMAMAGQHTFQLLTKRHGRMRSLLNDEDFQVRVGQMRYRLGDDGDFEDGSWGWPLPNVWLGVSVENQRWADIRIPALLDTPAAVRFLSCEPLLGPVDLTTTLGFAHTAHGLAYVEGVDWVIVGGESGRGARPMHPDWPRSLRDQCQTADIAFHFKQWGEWAPAGYENGTHLLQTDGRYITRESGTSQDPYGHGSGTQDLVDRGHPGWVRIRRPGKKWAGRQLDGRTWDDFPAVTA